MRARAQERARAQDEGEGEQDKGVGVSVHRAQGMRAGVGVCVRVGVSVRGAASLEARACEWGVREAGVFEGGRGCVSGRNVIAGGGESAREDRRRLASVVSRRAGRAGRVVRHSHDRPRHDGVSRTLRARRIPPGSPSHCCCPLPRYPHDGGLRHRFAARDDVWLWTLPCGRARREWPSGRRVNRTETSPPDDSWLFRERWRIVRGQSRPTEKHSAGGVALSVGLRRRGMGMLGEKDRVRRGRMSRASPLRLFREGAIRFECRKRG
ncbi:hypothetical protein B0H16DRAFT_1619033 [Mycena metata]|uniref:Uncharacterized protein n=1 Tax=Mycena metata TaxID=1033252 RepID=A0AAD7H832_9AGAR|nr:hypothetical protein B0H16DRAFT_1619033 [Mycena metata]